MKYIKKFNEPTSLTQFRALPGAYYDDYREKDELRKALIKEQETIDLELNAVLNLNIQTLVINRKNVLDFAIRKLTAENREGTWSKAILQKELRKWKIIGTEGKYEPYCRIVIFFLEKKLAKYA
jgi:hypothetical protein